MGCDIHMVLERKWRDKWVGVGIVDTEARGRNYELFGELAGVRGGDGEPRGVPPDASELSLMDIDGWDCDGHSHSWASLDEFLDAYIKTAPPHKKVVWVTERLEGDTTTALKYKLASELFGVWLDEHKDPLRIVYWFDN